MGLTYLLLIVVCAASLRLIILLRRRAARRVRLRPFAGIGIDVVAPNAMTERVIRPRHQYQVLCNRNLSSR